MAGRVRNIEHEVSADADDVVQVAAHMIAGAVQCVNAVRIELRRPRRQQGALNHFSALEITANYSAFCFELREETIPFLEQPAILERIAHGNFQRRQPGRLDQKVERTDLNRIDSGIERVHARQNDPDRRDFFPIGPTDQIQTAQSGHEEVGNDDVHVFAAQDLLRCRAVRCFKHAVQSDARQPSAHEHPCDRVIINDQDGGGVLHTAIPIRQSLYGHGYLNHIGVAMILPVDPRQLLRLRSWTRVACVVLISMGTLVLLGWLLGLDVLVTLLHPGRVAMNPLTAIEFILAGMALSRLQAEDAPAELRKRGSLIGGAMAVLAALTLVDNYLALPSVDRLLFASRLGANRMAPNTALNFILTGSALALLDRRIFGRYWWPQVAALVTAFIALIAITGYGQQQDRERSRNAGFDAHLVKPVQIDALVATLAAT